MNYCLTIGQMKMSTKNMVENSRNVCILNFNHHKIIICLCLSRGVVNCSIYVIK